MLLDTRLRRRSQPPALTDEHVMAITKGAQFEGFESNATARREKYRYDDQFDAFFNTNQDPSEIQQRVYQTQPARPSAVPQNNSFACLSSEDSDNEQSEHDAHTNVASSDEFGDFMSVDNSDESKTNKLPKKRKSYLQKYNEARQKKKVARERRKENQKRVGRCFPGDDC